jgi:hypothetical protein
MGIPGKETPDLPVGPDDSTAFHALQRLAVDDLATGWWFQEVGAEDSFLDQIASSPLKKRKTATSIKIAW